MRRARFQVGDRVRLVNTRLECDVLRVSDDGEVLWGLAGFGAAYASAFRLVARAAELVLNVSGVSWEPVSP